MTELKRPEWPASPERVGVWDAEAAVDLVMKALRVADIADSSDGQVFGVLAALRERLNRLFSAHRDAATVLLRHDAEPHGYEPALRYYLARTGAIRDSVVVREATQLLIHVNGAVRRTLT